MKFQLHAGSLALRARSRDVAEELEVSTSEVRLRPARAGHYRIDRIDDATFAGSWRGELWVDDVDRLTVAAGQRLELWRQRGLGSLQHRASSLPSDTLHMWAVREDAQEERSASSRYVSAEMTGAEDLDRHGRWDRHPEFGPIWIPLSVQIGWAPYRFGQWARVGPWGWTWVDAAPWGFAPFHYGRWVSWRGQWCWTPGAYAARPVYAPALVSWVGGSGQGGSVHAGGPRLPGSSWVPLAPHERYVPHFHASPGYHQHFGSQPSRPDRSTMPVHSPPMAVVAPPRQYEPERRHTPERERGDHRRHDRGSERGAPWVHVPAPASAAVAPVAPTAQLQPAPARSRRPVPVEPAPVAQVVAQVPAPTLIAPAAAQRSAPPARGHVRDHEHAREEPRSRTPESRQGGRERENQR